MDITTCIKERRSIRNFQTDKISHGTFEEIISLASFAPSWKNTQTVRYTLIEDNSVIRYLADNCVMDFEFNANTLYKAPNVVILTTVTGRCGYERDGSFSTTKEGGWEMFDAGVAAQTFCLAAHAKGYGTVIMGIFDEEKIHSYLNLPEGLTVSAVIALGLPAEHPAAPKRKEVAELVSYR